MDGVPGRHPAVVERPRPKESPAKGWDPVGRMGDWMEIAALPEAGDSSQGLK